MSDADELPPILAFITPTMFMNFPNGGFSNSDKLEHIIEGQRVEFGGISCSGSNFSPEKQFYYLDGTEGVIEDYEAFKKAYYEKYPQMVEINRAKAKR